MTVTLLLFFGALDDNTVTVNVGGCRRGMIGRHRLTGSEPSMLRAAALRRPGRPRPGGDMDDGSGITNGRRHGITEAAHLGDERTTVLGFLQHQRDLVAWKVAGASDEVLRSVATPSGLTVHGLVRHLEHVERWWVRDVFAGQDGLAYAWTDEDPDGELHVPAETSMAQLLEDYAAESALCDAVVAAAPSLDAVSSRRAFCLRWVLWHLVEETARHLGHLDLLREQADGAVGEEPPGPPAPATSGHGA